MMPPRRIAALALVLFGCTPNVVVGTREEDASVRQPDAAAPAAPQDAGRPDSGSDQENNQSMGMDSEDASMPSPPEAGMPAQTPPPQGGSAAPGCSSDAQCSDSDEPRCDQARNRCVECLSDADCDANALCESDGECDDRPIPCTTVAQCVGSDDPICHPTEQICVECVSDSDCPGAETCQPDFECD
jgi:hypothetical protein